LVRDAVIIAAVSAALLALMELSVRYLTPQTVQMTYHGGHPLGRADAVLGHVYQPSVQASARGPEFSVEYVTNAQGLRDNAPHRLPKPAGVTRILVLGDSFAFGAGNDYDRIWPVVFERQLAARGYSVDVVKAGVSAYDTTREALYLERLFPQYSPDIVLVAFLPNDLFSNRPLADRRTSVQQGDPAVRSEEDEPFILHSVLLGRRWLTSNDRLYVGLYSLTSRSDYFANPDSALRMQQFDVTENLLAGIQQYCANRGAAFAVLSIPQQVQVLARANDIGVRDFDGDLVDREFSQFARRTGFDWIPALPSLVERYRAERRDLYYRVDGHLNSAGNRVTGELLAIEFERRFAERLARTQAPPRAPSGE
jgi:hypothetical protein